MDGYCEKNAHPSIYSNIASGLTAGDRGNGYETINYYVENVIISIDPGTSFSLISSSFKVFLSKITIGGMVMPAALIHRPRQ